MTIQTIERMPSQGHPADVAASLRAFDGSVTEITVEIRIPVGLVTVAGVTLQGQAMLALLEAQDAYGRPILPLVVSSYRSYAEQAALYEDRENNPLPVAVPGTSWHEKGLAVDIASVYLNATLVAVMAAHGWIRDVMPEDPPHFHYVRPLVGV